MCAFSPPAGCRPAYRLLGTAVRANRGNLAALGEVLRIVP